MVYIIHENEEWIRPLKVELDTLTIPYTEWNLTQGTLDLKQIPPNGVFYNRMSASAHTRGNQNAPDLAASVLSWLESYDRRVVNSRRSLQLELSKGEQHVELEQAGLGTPRTAVAIGKKEIMDAARSFNQLPFIIKPNRGGKGQGVTLISELNELEKLLSENEIHDLTIDGVMLIQEYIPPKDGKVVRMEFIEGKFYYAVEVDTGGSFELCPADICEIPDNKGPDFNILDGFSIPEIEKCEAFLNANHIEIAGMEFLEDNDENRYFYDVNTNTNYNSNAEEKNGKLKGMKRVAEFLKSEVDKVEEFQLK